MEITKKAVELNNILSKYKQYNKTIGFVPTMGALHKGHISLVNKAGEQTDIVVVSIFVNPTQFNNSDDLKNYPRELDKDIKLLESTKCTVVYCPDVEDVYPEEDTRVFNFGELSNVMEGVFRPGHFNGVAQVVSRLFDIVKPNKAFFGQKDFQQLAIINKMVEMLGLSIEIVPCPIVREDDGLALSSRNLLLTDEERKSALEISKTLFLTKELMNDKSIVDLVNFAVDKLNNTPLLKVEYFSIVDGNTLQEVSNWDESDYIVGCITVYAGKIRLIDNLIYKEPSL